MSSLGEIGTIVWCNDKKMRGKVVSEASLGISGAPCVEFPNGQRCSYFGDSINKCCPYIDSVIDLLRGCSQTDLDLDLIRNLWFENIAGVYQRRDFYNRIKTDPTFDLTQYLECLQTPQVPA
jgi:hypothetical protein